MAKGSGFFQSKVFKVGMARVYGLGAAVVILGALFKIIHTPGGNYMLVAGLVTEAFIFAISAFEPVREEPDWTLVYPELAGMDAPAEGRKISREEEKESVTSELEKMLEEAKIEQETINKLGEGLRNLSQNVEALSSTSNAALATDTYAKRVHEAADNIGRINDSYGRAIDAINQLGDTSDASKEYSHQVQEVTQKLASLNSVYEMELQESNNHIKAMNSFYGSLNQTVENLGDSQDTAVQLREEINKLSRNLSNLNSVYGNMLSAMTATRSTVE